MAACSNCGGSFPDERATLGYDYCMRRECLDAKRRSLRILAVGLNKAAEDYRVMDEDAEREIREGRLKDQRRQTYGKLERRTTGGKISSRRRPPARERKLPGTPSQQRSVRAQAAQGLKPEAIAERTGLSRYQVTQILLDRR